MASEQRKLVLLKADDGLDIDVLARFYGKLTGRGPTPEELKEAEEILEEPENIEEPI